MIKFTLEHKGTKTDTMILVFIGQVSIVQAKKHNFEPPIFHNLIM